MAPKRSASTPLRPLSDTREAPTNVPTSLGSSMYDLRATQPSPGKASPFKRAESVDWVEECEHRLEHTKGVLGQLVSPSSTSAPFRARAGRTGLGYRGGLMPLGTIDDQTEQIRMKDQLARKKIDLECDSQTLREYLSVQTDADLRRSILKVLGDSGFESRHLNGIKKIVLKVIDSTSAQASRDAARLFTRFAESISGRLQGMTEAELLAASTLLAEAAVQAVAPAGGYLPTVAEVKARSRSLREQIVYQTEALRFEQDYDPSQVQLEKLLGPAETERLRKQREYEAKTKDMLANETLRSMVEKWTTEENRLRDRLARAQENIKDLLSEKEDQTRYLRNVLTQQLERLQGEKNVGRMRYLQLPCTFVRICVKPKEKKSKGKLVLVDPPDELILERVQQVLAGAARLYRAKPEHVAAYTMHGMLNVFDVTVTGFASVRGVSEVLGKSVHDKGDFDGVRGVIGEFANLDTAVVKPVWPIARLKHEVEERLGDELTVSANLVEQVSVVVEACNELSRPIWEELVSSEEAKAREEGEIDELAALLDTKSFVSHPTAARQGASSLEELMTDAARAQLLLKAAFAPDTEWAQAVLDAPPDKEQAEDAAPVEHVSAFGGDDPEAAAKAAADAQAAAEAAAAAEIHSDDPRRSWHAPVPVVPEPKVEDEERDDDEEDEEDVKPPPPPPEPEAVLPGGVHYDPGIKFEHVVLSKMCAIKRWDDEEPFRDVHDVSRLSVSFATVSQLLVGVERVLKMFDVVWCDNGFQNPSCLGFRNFNFGVRQQLSVDEHDKAGGKRDHISELRLSLAQFETFRQSQGHEHLKNIKQAIRENGDVKSKASIDTLQRIFIKGMELTEGRAHTEADHQMCYVPPVVSIPHASRDIADPFYDVSDGASGADGSDAPAARGARPPSAQQRPPSALRRPPAEGSAATETGRGPGTTAPPKAAKFKA